MLACARAEPLRANFAFGILTPHPLSLTFESVGCERWVRITYCVQSDLKVVSPLLHSRPPLSPSLVFTCPPHEPPHCPLLISTAAAWCVDAGACGTVTSVPMRGLMGVPVFCLSRRRGGSRPRCPLVFVRLRLSVGVFVQGWLPPSVVASTMAGVYVSFFTDLYAYLERTAA